MNSAEISEIKLSLIQKRQRILNQVNAFKESQQNRTPLSDGDDVAVQAISDNIAIHLQEKDREDLLKIDRALSRMEEPAFGQCEDCGDEIGLRRILANPTTTTCLSCKEEQESKKPH